MRVMVLVKATADSERGILPTAGAIAATDRFDDELAAAGICRNGEGLKPSASGRRVILDGSDRIVVDGPFAATNEPVAGF